MQIQTQRPRRQTALRPQPSPQAVTLAEPEQPKEKYEPWVPFANAAFVGAAVGIPSALGAIGNSLLGGELATTLTWTALPVVAGIGATMFAMKGAKEEFNGHPILTGISGLAAGGAAAIAAPLLATAGSSFGWTGAAVATGVGAVGAGVISAVGIHHANKKAG